ncbi:Uma2 family endonuclease [Streptomyces sp. NBC_00320]|uniref:hypothetical protein n=1 Tax=Streptomyces sp. NBC_00320 TaxID=2975711 RepID=UPI002252BDB3|nr:hypothetical protein [Streptomyces sp. NBC_00320]MCX5146189.1 Uma2 family endonuclease [Streptomyces sp. NBC_00320]
MSREEEEATAVMQHETTIAEAAGRLSKELPRHRVEILQGGLTATPPADGAHALTLSRLIERFYEAGAKKAGLRYVQGTGVRLPAGPEVDAYAKADIPFYVVADRRHDEVVICRDPCRGPGR